MLDFRKDNLYDKPERCVLVGMVRVSRSRWEIEDQLEELRALAQTSGAEIIEQFIQERVTPDPAYFIGRGKVEELADFVQLNEIDLVIFDDELSPAQTRNIENIVGKKVIDRSALILDIFADHARSAEAKVQVELAQLNYLLPRLTRQWQHLSRQVGGIGTKGPGETQLETDRRLVRRRIAHLKDRLEHIENQSRIQRQQRKNVFRAALIGYTNAGKSTLMNTLSDAGVVAEDRLFATLDTTVRRIDLSNNTTVLLSDTVGFIRKLPHHLVASFRTTLSEALEADLLIHVVDLSHPNHDAHIEVVRSLLHELDIATKPRLLVFNKVDRIKNSGRVAQIAASYPQAILLSARRHIGINLFKQELIRIIENQYEIKKLKLNYQMGPAEHLIHPIATVLEKKSDDSYLYLTVKYAREHKSAIEAIAEKYK